MKSRLSIFLLVVFISIPPVATGQAVKGKVIDAGTRKPLAFVNIVYNSYGNGIASGIDGNFELSGSTEVDFLKISYLGYETKHISREEIRQPGDLVIRLEPTRYSIEEVTITPGVNPAHRIIKAAVANRDNNNPEKMRSFSYTSYNKLFVTVRFDTSLTTAGADSSLRQSMDFFDRQHLFLMESVSERDYMYPGRNKETVLASRVSGFKDPSFTLLATQLQSFSFYEELISIMDRKYLNPISRGSTRKYLFVLEDTMFTERNDTLYVISFRPLRGRNFDGLKGMLHINTYKYAVQHVIAEADAKETLFRVRIQQKYDLAEGVQWFPVQLNTDIIFQPEEMESGGVPMAVVGIGKSYLRDIVLEPDLKRRHFSHVEIRIQDQAYRRSQEYWDRYRVVPLTGRDTTTYEFIDSIGEAADFDRTLAIFETVASGYIPWRFLNIDYRSIFDYNHYEGFRFGIAAETNQNLSPWFSLGGKVAYGLRDKAWKYGGMVRLNLYPPGGTYLALAYDSDVMESGGYRFLEKPPFTSSEIYRTFLIRNKDLVESRELRIGSALLPFFRMEFFFNQSSKQVTGNYAYSDNQAGDPSERQRFLFTEYGARFRYAFREKFMQTPRGHKISLGTDHPVVQANLTRGTRWLRGEFEYLKIEGRVSKSFVTRNFGESSITLTGGMVNRDIPFPNLYNGQGSYGTFTVETENSFATMRMNEFISDRFASVFFKQNFRELLFRTERFEPEIALVQNIGFGMLKHQANHLNTGSTGTLEQGYFESGLMVNNLLNQMFVGYGLGVFYRYGPYQLDKTIDNFAFKFTISINLN